MAYTPHTVVKPEKIVASAIGVATQQMTLPNLFTRKGYEDFKGAEGDTLTYKVPGRLVPRKYAFRNDRSNPLVFDTYKEAKTTITWGDKIYSGVKITDEQAEFDLDNPNALQVLQGEAVARGLNTEMATAIETAPYLFTIGGIVNVDGKSACRQATGEARKILNTLGMDQAGRILVVGANFEQTMADEDKLVLANYVGDAIASQALTTATLGQVNGFRIVTDYSIDPDAAYALLPTSFVLVTGAPAVPTSVPAGAATSFGGFSMRWMKDYDFEYQTDRSVVDAYAGVSYVKDRWISPKQAMGEVQDPAVDELFVRGIKLTLGGVSAYPAGTTNVGLETGLTTGWVNPIKPVV